MKRKRKYTHRPETIKKMADRRLKKLSKRMTQIRAKNNDLWMKMFLIACISNPKQAKRVVPKIMKKDARVNKTMGLMLEQL